MDKLTSMRVFCRVVARENFSQAARDLHISPAMVTKHIAALEEQLNVRLLNRTTRTVSTTEAGERYYHICRNMLADLEDAESSLAELGSRPAGTLKLTAPVDFGVLCLAPAIARYLALYPEVKIDISYQDKRVNLVEEGFDMAIRIGTLADSSLVAQRIMPQRMFCCAAPAYIEQHGAPKLPAELRQHSCLTYTYSSTNNEWQFRREGDNQAVRVSGRLNANNGRAIVAAAVEGVGIIMKPEFMLRESLDNGQLVKILEGWEIPSSNVYAVYPHRQYLPAKMSSFIGFLKEYFGEDA
ncbi:LysR family transcriptional regulator [Motiliproteus sediminis]|uniref:LysR family transcriptional regulator n=1 Tax=Motiliproteus sediminis TaxID=1468178 RepID=UPI001AEFAF59|nr:LysR family transcriptional regulator [Motiliproteus sediminis]